MIFREFLCEQELHREVGLDRLPDELGEKLGCSPDEAIAEITRDTLLDALSLQELEQIVAIRDMTFVSRTAAALAADLKRPEVTYEACCRTALCYAVAGLESHVFTALRAAASKDDSWARHHFLYGLVLGAAGNQERALWEFDMALRREPYEDARVRVRRAMDLVEKGGGASTD
jgi:hypothetical protein